MQNADVLVVLHKSMMSDGRFRTLALIVTRTYDCVNVRVVKPQYSGSVRRLACNKSKVCDATGNSCHAMITFIGSIPPIIFSYVLVLVYNFKSSFPCDYNSQIF
jgi:hypothetical protein